MQRGVFEAARLLHRDILKRKSINFEENEGDNIWGLKSNDKIVEKKQSDGGGKKKHMKEKYRDLGIFFPRKYSKPGLLRRI